MACNHTIHKHNHHFGWDNSIEPTLSVAPGQTVEIETIDSSGGQLNAGSVLSDLSLLSFEKVNPVTGPIFIEGQNQEMRWPSHFWIFNPPVGAGRRIFQGLVYWRISSQIPLFISGSMTLFR